MTTTTTYSIPTMANSRSKIRVGACSACVVARRFLFLLLTSLSALLTACITDDIQPAEGDAEDAASQPYVELRIAVPPTESVTRANPMGGEEGNGREQGVINEDKIHNINVFFYTGDAGMNSADNTPILNHFYYNLEDSNDSNNSTLMSGAELDKIDKTTDSSNSYYGTQYVTLRFKCTEELAKKADNVNFVAVANIGSMNGESITTLGALRDIDITKFKANSWSTDFNSNSNNAADMDNFLMSTAYNDECTYGGKSTGTNKFSQGKEKEYIGTTTLQRLYARLDLWYNNSSDEDKNNVVMDGGNIKELKYRIIDKDKEKTPLNHYVYLTNVLPVNVMQKPSYLFKKVTDGLTSFKKSDFTGWTAKYNWGGKESPSTTPTAGSDNDRPENYVMEPHSLDKNPITVINNMPKEQALAYDASTLNTWYGSTRTSQVKTDITNPSNGQFTNYYNQGRSKGPYDPDYGCNHISIISYANENTHPTDCFHSSYLTGLAFRAVYVPDKIYKSYGEITGSDGTTTTGLTQWTLTDEAPTKIYRYSRTQKTQQYESLSIYFTNLKAAQDYAKDHPEDMAIISTEENAYSAVLHDGKWGFICYYNLWLRHYNDESADPQETYPMEYATVRNNIYRVAVDFSGPGDPEPTMREPDTMKARIFVRKWNYRKESEIDF